MRVCVWQGLRSRLIATANTKHSNFPSLVAIHNFLSNEQLWNELLSMFLLSKCHIIEWLFYRCPKKESNYRNSFKENDCQIDLLQKSPKKGVQGAAAP